MRPPLPTTGRSRLQRTPASASPRLSTPTRRLQVYAAREMNNENRVSEEEDAVSTPSSLYIPFSVGTVLIFIVYCVRFPIFFYIFFPSSSSSSSSCFFLFTFFFTCSLQSLAQEKHDWQLKAEMVGCCQLFLFSFLCFFSLFSFSFLTGNSAVALAYLSTQVPTSFNKPGRRPNTT